MSYLLGFSTLVSGRENYWLVNIQSSVCSSYLWFCWALRKRKSKPVWRKNDGYSLNASNLVKEIKCSIFLVSNFIVLFLSYLIPVYVLGPQVKLVLYKVVMKMVIRFDLIYKSLYVRNLSSEIGKWSHLGGCLCHWSARPLHRWDEWVCYLREGSLQKGECSLLQPPLSASYLTVCFMWRCFCLVMALQHWLHRMLSPWYPILDAQVPRTVRKNCQYQISSMKILH